MKTETYILCNIFCVIIVAVAVMVFFLCPDDKVVSFQVKQERIHVVNK